MSPRLNLRSSFHTDVPPGTSSGGGGGIRRVRVYLLLAIFVVILGIFVWVRHSQREQEHARELKNELQQLRNAVLIYVTRFGSPPPELSTLTGTHLSFAGSARRPMLEGMTFDDEERMVDPYGYPYTYDRATGTVYSSAPCCKNW